MFLHFKMFYFKIHFLLQQSFLVAAGSFVHYLCIDRLSSPALQWAIANVTSFPLATLTRHEANNVKK